VFNFPWFEVVLPCSLQQGQQFCQQGGVPQRVRLDDL